MSDKNLTLAERSLAYHKDPVPGKLKVIPSKPCVTQQDLSLAYTPGVAIPCLEIKKNKDNVWSYTNRSNSVAVVSDGTAVLGLGNIGPEAGMPVMEGKAVLFKSFADIDAIPLCLSHVHGEDGKTDADKLIEAVRTAVVRQQDKTHLKPDAIPALLDDELPQQAITSAFRKYSK